MSDSPECSMGQHKACPGYTRVTHSCDCPCHQQSKILGWRCVACGEEFRAWAPAERHADTHDGGARLEVVL